MISKENILKLEIRQKIYRYISDNPGLHLREIQRRTRIPYATLKYHLKYLEKHNLISTKSEKGYKRYATSDEFSKKEREILNFFRQEIPRYILIYVLFYFVCSQVELSKALEKTPAAIGFHLKKLRKSGVIEKLPKDISYEGWGRIIKRNRASNNEILYSYSKPEVLHSIYNMLIVCKDSLPDQKIIKEVTYHYNEFDDFGIYKLKKKWKMSRPRSIYRIFNNPDAAIDKAIEVFFEACPHPYHV